MATWAEALLVWCEKCDAQKGQPCTYVVEQEIFSRPSWMGGVEPRTVVVHSIGEPTSRPHNERFARADEKFHPRHSRKLVKRPSEWRLEIARAENAFERREQQRVFQWLIAYGSILQTTEEELDADRS